MQAVEQVLNQHARNPFVAHRAVAILSNDALKAHLTQNTCEAIVYSMGQLSACGTFQHSAMSALLNIQVGIVQLDNSTMDRIIAAITEAINTHNKDVRLVKKAMTLLSFLLTESKTAGSKDSYRALIGVLLVWAMDLVVADWKCAVCILQFMLDYVKRSASNRGRVVDGAVFSKTAAEILLLHHQFAYFMMQAMVVHFDQVSVQVLACDVVGVATTGTTPWCQKRTIKALMKHDVPGAIVAALNEHWEHADLVKKGVNAFGGLLFRKRKVFASKYVWCGPRLEAFKRISQRLMDQLTGVLEKISAECPADNGEACMALVAEIRKGFVDNVLVLLGWIGRGER